MFYLQASDVCKLYFRSDLGSKVRELEGSRASLESDSKPLGGGARGSGQSNSSSVNDLRQIAHTVDLDHFRSVHIEYSIKIQF